MKETIIRNSNEKAEGGNGITELVFILDRSGSMQGLESDSAGGFNSVINEQKKKDGRVWVSTVLFNDHSKVLHDRVDINGIEPMKTEDYIVGGCTALLDALGDAIHHSYRPCACTRLDHAHRVRAGVRRACAVAFHHEPAVEILTLPIVVNLNAKHVYAFSEGLVESAGRDVERLPV